MKVNALGLVTTITVLCMGFLPLEKVGATSKSLKTISDTVNAQQRANDESQIFEVTNSYLTGSRGDRSSNRVRTMAIYRDSTGVGYALVVWTNPSAGGQLVAGLNSGICGGSGCQPQGSWGQLFAGGGEYHRDDLVRKNVGITPAIADYLFTHQFDPHCPPTISNPQEIPSQKNVCLQSSRRTR